MKITVAPRVWTASVDQNGRIKLATLGVQGPPGPPGAKASQAQAEAGTDDATYMTPLKTAQAVAAAPVSTATTTAITAAVAQAVDDLLNGAPAALDTLKELADALGDDANFAATMTAALAGKLSKASNLSDLASIATALVNLGLDQVDNTRDANKPVSTAQAAADALKVAKAGDTMTGALTVPSVILPNASTTNYLVPTLGISGFATGVTIAGNTKMFFASNGFGVLSLQNGLALLKSSVVLGFGNADINGAADTGLSRGAAGQVNVGNGTAGDASGTLKAATLTATSSMVGGASTTKITTTGGYWSFASANVFVGQFAASAAIGGTYSGLQAPSFGFVTSGGGTPNAGLSSPSAGVVSVDGATKGDATGQLKLAGVQKVTRLVSQLPTPTSGLAGLEMVVSDASAPSYGDVLVGGGSDVRGARCTGSDWRAC